LVELYDVTYDWENPSAAKKKSFLQTKTIILETLENISTASWLKTGIRLFQWRLITIDAITLMHVASYISPEEEALSNPSDSAHEDGKPSQFS